LRDRAQKLDQFALSGRIQERGGFVEDQQVRLHGKDTRDGNTALFAGAQVVRGFAGSVSHSDSVQAFGGSGVGCRGR
jgi:hypothetical protein